ncbi:MAG: Na-translocating system protein MpsC family protein [Microcoleus sp.]
MSKDLIKEVLGVEVTDFLTDAILETGRTGTIAILESVSKVLKQKRLVDT